MSSFFISYRRDDSAAFAGRLYDHLCNHFGEDRLFMDVHAIEPGQDFVEAIERAVSACQALVAVIGRHWFGPRGDGSRRLDEPEDHVHVEIAAALRRGVLVVPVLMEDTAMPRSSELPATLQGLVRRNALRVKHESFRSDVQTLIRALKKLSPGAAAPPAILSATAPPSQTVQRPSSAGTVTRLDIPEASYASLILSPNERDLYLTRFREKVNYSLLWDLMHYDLSTGRLTDLGDVGKDYYLYGFQGSLFYKAQPTAEGDHSRLLCFDGATRVHQPTDHLELLSFSVVGGSFVMKIGENHWWWDNSQLRLVRIPLEVNPYNIYWSHSVHRIALLGIKQRPPKKDESLTDIPSDFILVEFDDRFHVKTSRKILIETETLRFNRFTAWTDTHILFAENHDTNGDGKVDYKDTRNRVICSLNLATGEAFRVLPDRYDLWSLKGFPSGQLYFVDWMSGSRSYHLYQYNPATSDLVLVKMLTGGQYGVFQFQREGRFAIYLKTLDSPGKGQYYLGENLSEIYRIDLA